MMKTKINWLKLFFILTFISQNAWAENITVNIQGRVLASPCVVDTAIQSVDFGKMSAVDLQQPGSYSPAIKSFKITVKDCPESTTSVKAQFSGLSYPDDNSGYGSSGSAQNIGIKVIPANSGWSDNSLSPIDGSWVKGISSITHSADFDFQARVYSATGNATSGSIYGAMLVTFIYD
ncbi:type 1 fimbrial protein [Budviciaceae bacterium CWB-B4]|uniref:Type 1 fimbrial protein n=1 Tax=Limnobaculum xujianqingii TaxID=2738837 RepID=A0A9D7AJX3_9GAMM|nr:fimbrial protein [Limnobaculum xujianqingii]MBK5073869.1 type 1 fimbrial protein [Limnobaculum xujianqingii]MBK5177237.1 type 1 fimbrial protein [Limnobaculum xujianqingii]